MAMRYFSYDELHKIIETNPELKKRSDEIHSLPQAKNWDDFLAQKLQMLKVYAQAVGCCQVQNAQDGVRAVVEYLKQHGKPMEKLKDGQYKYIREQEKTQAEQKKCHAPSANSYTCYCDLK